MSARTRPRKKRLFLRAGVGDAILLFPVERLEYGYTVYQPVFFSVVYFSRGTLPKKGG